MKLEAHKALHDKLEAKQHKLLQIENQLDSVGAKLSTLTNEKQQIQMDIKAIDSKLRENEKKMEKLSKQKNECENNIINMNNQTR